MGKTFDLAACLSARRREIEQMFGELSRISSQIDAAKAKDLPGLALRARLLARYIEIDPAGRENREIAESLAKDLEEMARAAEAPDEILDALAEIAGRAPSS